MYVIFIHISGLALIEILFYFYYIGNMETQMFIKNINHLLNNEKMNINYIMYNSTIPQNINYTYIDYYKSRADNGEKERNENNYHLFSDAIIGFVVIISITMFVILFEFYYKKEEIKKIGSMESINNVCLEMVEYRHPQNEIIPQNEIPVEKKNNIKTIIFHVILYSGLLISFEYWLFNYIVMKYKVISNEEIEYLFAKKIHDTI